MDTHTATASDTAKANIAALIDDLDLKKSAVARDLGVSRAHFGKILGPDRPLRVDELVSIALILSVPVSVLLTPRGGIDLRVERKNWVTEFEALEAWLWIAGIQPALGMDWTHFYRSSEDSIRSWQMAFRQKVLGSDRFRFDEKAGVVEYLDEDGNVVLSQRTGEDPT